jgi:KDO2-lipid IV(A) lauroyltransferase
MAKIKYRRYYIYYLLKVAISIVSFLPLRVSLVIADLLGKLVFALLPKYRRVAIDNLNEALGPDEARNAKIVRKLFSNLVKNGAEWIKLAAIDPSDLDKVVTESEGLENLDEGLRGGKGVIVLAFHFGNWELTGMYLRHKGYPGQTIVRRLYFHKYDKLINRVRKHFDVHVIYRDESPKKMLKVLKANGIMGIVPDQDIDSIEGTFVNFFGRPAFTPTAPVKLAMVSGAKIVPVFVVRKADGTHKLFADKVIDVSSATKSEEDVRKCTQEWSDVLERFVREYPDQWVWVHERWKTQPDAGAAEPALTGRGSEK